MTTVTDEQTAKLTRFLHGVSERALKASSKTINPRDTLTTRQGLWVDSDLEVNIGLAECPADDRPLKLIHTVTRGGQNDSSIANSVGGKDTLNARKSTMGQLVREVQLALDGEKGLFKKGQYYLLYLEAPDGTVHPVRVFWDGYVSEWRVCCFRFDQFSKWRGGRRVFGN